MRGFCNEKISVRVHPNESAPEVVRRETDGWIDAKSRAAQNGLFKCRPHQIGIFLQQFVEFIGPKQSLADSACCSLVPPLTRAQVLKI